MGNEERRFSTERSSIATSRAPLLAAVLLLACAPSERETRALRSVDFGRTSTRFSYNSAGEIEAIEHFQADTLQTRAEFVYQGGLISSQTITTLSGPFGDLDGTYEYNYQSSVLVGLKYTYKSGEVTTWSFDFTSGRLEKVLWDSVQPHSTGQSTLRYQYDHEGNLAGSTEEWSMSFGTDRFEKNEATIFDFKEGRLNRISTSTTAGRTSHSVDYSYGNGSSIITAHLDTGTVSRISYASDGLISQIETEYNPSTRTTAKYEYEDFSAKGFSFTPFVPHAVFFDMRGISYQRMIQVGLDL